MQYRYQALKKLRRGIPKKRITAACKNAMKPFFRRYLAKKRRERIVRAKKVAKYGASESIEEKLEMVNKIFGCSVSLEEAMSLYQ